MTHANQPLVSCLCLTRKRPEHLSRAVRCFLAQTYPNKELIIVYPASDTGTAECLRQFDSPQLRPHPLTRPGATLGDLRNYSIECAAGRYVCGWDDDDWHNPDRIRRQLSTLMDSKKDASVMARIFIYDMGQQKAYLSCERMWENSVFFDKEQIAQLGIRYPSLDKGEDFQFVDLLLKHNLVYPMHDPTSYVYNITGSNTWNASHFSAILKRSNALNEQQTQVVKSAVDQTSSPVDAFHSMETREFKSPITYVRFSPMFPRV